MLEDTPLCLTCSWVPGSSRGLTQRRRPARPGSLAEGTKREASHALILLSPVHNDGSNLERRQTTELEFEKDQDSRMEAAYVTGIVQTLIPGQPQVVRMG